MVAIVQITPRAGDRVLTGDMIFQLDSTKAELAVQIAKRKLEEAQRQVDRSKLLERSRVSSNARTEDANTVFERASLGASAGAGFAQRHEDQGAL